MTPVRRMFSSLRPHMSDSVRREYEGKIRDLWRQRADATVRHQLRYTIHELRLITETQEDGCDVGNDKTG